MSTSDHDSPLHRGQVSDFLDLHVCGKVAAMQAAAFDQTGMTRAPLNTGPLLQGGESDKDKGTSKHAPGDGKGHVSDSIYMFPESYNALRRELFYNWPNLWKLVGWSMAFDAPKFVESMNAACEINVVFDSDMVDFTCKQYLRRLHELRGVQ